MISSDFERTLAVVSDVTEIDSKTILSTCRRMECVEARMLLCRVMKDIGYHPVLIAKKMRMSANSVRALIETYTIREKIDKILSKMYAEIMRKLSVK